MATQKKPSKRIPPKAPKAKRDRVVLSDFFITQQAAAIVGQVLVYFGAGYAAQRQTERSAPDPPEFTAIFHRQRDFRAFHHLLMDSTTRNFVDLNWDTNEPLREQVFEAAFEHGKACRVAVVAEGTVTLRLGQILSTLETIQSVMCPGGSGGGPICDF